jgi:hypothetical protein
MRCARREGVQRLTQSSLCQSHFRLVIKMFASDGATREIISKTGRIAGDSAINFGRTPAK